jgi:hypothetical protein
MTSGPRNGDGSQQAPLLSFVFCALLISMSGLRMRSVRVVDAWMQHPTARFLDDPLFDSLKRMCLLEAPFQCG